MYGVFLHNSKVKKSNIEVINYDFPNSTFDANNTLIHRDYEQYLSTLLNTFKQKTIVLAGESGSGKTTLINQVLQRNNTKYIYVKAAEVDKMINEIEMLLYRRTHRNNMKSSLHEQMMHYSHMCDQPQCVVVIDNFDSLQQEAIRMLKTLALQKIPKLLFVFIVNNEYDNFYEKEFHYDYILIKLSFSPKEIVDYFHNMGILKPQIIKVLQDEVYFKNFAQLQSYGNRERHSKLLVRFRSYHGLFLSAGSDGKLLANKPKAKNQETFEITRTDNYITIKSSYNKYLSADPMGRVVIDRNTPAEWERFILQEITPSTYALKTYHGKYICVENHKHNVVANRDAVRQWEQLEIFLV